MSTTQRPTPETDAVIKAAIQNEDEDHERLAYFARKLERERDEAREQLEAMREAIKEAHAFVDKISESARSPGGLPMCPECLCIPAWDEEHNDTCSISNLLSKLQPFLKP